MNAIDAFAEPIQRGGVRQPHEAGGVEPFSGGDRDVGVGQQGLGESVGADEPGRLEHVGDVREQVERAARLDASESEGPRSARNGPRHGAGDTRPASS